MLIADALAASIILAAFPPEVSLPASSPVPALQVISTYGRLAGPECYGKVAPAGSSCQLPLSYLKNELGWAGDGLEHSLTKEEFGKRLGELPFCWPLKPYGINNDKSLAKTVSMNKGAETAIYMDELERRGLYDRRNPTGPLPTSLRPKINQEITKEGIDSATVDTIFGALSGGSAELTDTQLDKIFGRKEAFDYYDFLSLVGNENIKWPHPLEAR